MIKLIAVAAVALAAVLSTGACTQPAAQNNLSSGKVVSGSSSPAGNSVSRAHAISPPPTGNNVSRAHVNSPPPLVKVHDPRQVTGTISGRCAYRDHGQLPDPRCTPGSIDPAVTQADIYSTICKKGWTKTVRPPESQTERFKYGQAYIAYGTTGRTELDHLVPLELGGSNDAANLWPETPPTPNPKDDVENALNHAVCGGEVTLAAAQAAIAANWMTAEARLRL